MAFCGFLKAERNRNREEKLARRKTLLRGHPGVGLRLTCDHAPPEFAERLLEGSTLKATDDEKLGGFDQVLFRLFLRPALRGDIQRWTVRNVPTAFFFEDTKQLKLGLNYGLHVLHTCGKEVVPAKLYTSYRCIVNDLRCVGM